MPLVKRVAWHVHGRVGRAVEIEDLSQAGMVGLVEAANRGHGVSDDEFEIYALRRIRGSMLDLVRRHAHLSRTEVQRKRLMREARRAFEADQGRVPSAAELATSLQISLEELGAWEAGRASHAPESLDEIVELYGDWFPAGEPTPEGELEQAQLLRQLQDALATLDERLQLILQLYFLEEMNLREIAAVLGLTIGRVSQLKSEAVSKVGKTLDKALSPRL